MTDKEMLLIAYGALKAEKDKREGLKQIVEILEEYLFPTPTVMVAPGLTDIPTLGPSKKEFK